MLCVKNLLTDDNTEMIPLESNIFIISKVGLVTQSLGEIITNSESFETSKNYSKKLALLYFALKIYLHTTH
jgi:hypothetical protein